MKDLLGDFRDDISAQRGDSKPPTFNQAWTNNVVLCPIVAWTDFQISVRRRVIGIVNTPLWEEYKWLLKEGIPEDCPYRLEHTLDGTQPEDTIRAKIGKRNV